MKNGICPKCKAEEIYHGLATDGEGLSAGSYCLCIEIIAGASSDEREQKTLWIDTYICSACGYVEMYVSNWEDLPNLPKADGWIKVEAEHA